jgi:pimeloyl-ACP methyl ester carboxylesterase
LRWKERTAAAHLEVEVPAHLDLGPTQSFMGGSLAFGTGGLIAVDPVTRQQTKVASLEQVREPFGMAFAADNQVVVTYTIRPNASRGAVMRVNTDTGVHQAIMVRAIVGRHGYLPGLVLTNAEIAGIEQPTLMVYGAADPIGSIASWRRFTGRLPQGELEVVEGGGHLVWYSDPVRVGARVAQFLTG